MLSVTIRTTDDGTGRELPIPTDLRDRVERAATILAAQLAAVGEKFDIDVHWWFEPAQGTDWTVWLRLAVLGRVFSYVFPKDDLRDEDATRHRLWTPIRFIIPTLSEEVDRQFARLRHDLDALVAVGD